MKPYCIFFSALLLTACGQIQPQTQEINFATVNNGEYMALTYDGRTYVPFCAGSSERMGERIGNYSADGSETNLVYVYAVKGQPQESWLMDATGENCRESMLYREISVTEYPEGFVPEPEYRWNPQKNGGTST